MPVPHRHALLALSLCTVLGACEQSADPEAQEAAASAAEPAAATVAESTAPAEPSMPEAMGPERRLAEVLLAQPEEVQARYIWRHPQETLGFFGIEPGMTVVEALPGGGWYSKILSAYLGTEGTLVGVDYSLEMYPKFGYMDEAALEKKQAWAGEWVQTASSWHADGASAQAYHFGALPEEMAGQADAVLFIRALHNLARFENDGGFLGQAIDNAYTVLKPGGVVGVVQHRAPADASDDWADGSRGYLKQAALVDKFEAAGFVLEESSELNANPADQPGEDDRVWRLPPTLGGSQDNPEQAAAMQAIGESDRMTLRFRKPA